MNDNTKRLREAFAEGFTLARKDTAGVSTDDDLVEDFWNDSMTLRQHGAVPPEASVTRIEVIDQSGRAYVQLRCHIELSYQDQGHTLKVFVTD